LEQLEAFRQKKAQERHDRLERIHKRLEQTRGTVGTGAVNQAAQHRGEVQKPSSRRPVDGGLLKDSTNCVNNSSTSTAGHQLSARAKLVAGRLKQSGTVAGRRLTVTLSETDETDTREKHANEENSSGQTGADENVSDDNHPTGDTCKLPVPGKR